MLNYIFDLSIFKFSNICDPPSKLNIISLSQQAPPVLSFELYVISIFYF